MAEITGEVTNDSIPNESNRGYCSMINASKKRYYLGVIVAIILISLLLINFMFHRRFTVKHPPLPNRVRYSYYRIVDESNGKTLTYISSVKVEKGDEYVTTDNRRFVVIRVVRNQAFAKYTGKVAMKK